MQEQPHTIEVFNLDENGKIKLNPDFVKIFQQHKFKNKKVCVISIAGAFRQGKSFLLNFFLRYLHKKYKLKKKNVSDWMNQNDADPLSGFSWKAGSTLDTVGILIWSELFLAELPSGEEVAIILMDTQGSFDNETTITNCATIFGLSALLSSVQIYNLKENIKQCDLSHLECFLGYGEMSRGNMSHSFQKLLFLIRDWQIPYEKEYGYEGGEKLLQEVLNTENSQSQDVISLKKNIKKSFKKIECCLLPHPGMTVATSKTFKGDIEEIDSEFRKQVKILVETLLKPENLEPKMSDGKLVTLEEFIHLMRNYETCFRDDEVPLLKSLFLATAEIHHTSAIKKAEQMYEALLIKSESQQEANEIKSTVLDEFRKKKKMGTPALKKKYEDLLIQGMEDILYKYRYSLLWKWTLNSANDSRVVSAVGVTIVSGAVGTVLGPVPALGLAAKVVCGVSFTFAGIIILGAIKNTVELVIWKTRPLRKTEIKVETGNEEADTATENS
ncbi:atlastin-like isoform X2 [Tenebrio molitor]|uniref:atlastin-like isoform X2 n=1 Tax=Tenebrio molitor TaxID=7067 RepID=UPI0036247D90